MKRQAQPKNAASIQLFPFLAVLLCTMGALLILLVIIARQAREQVARELSANSGVTEELERRRSDAAWALANLQTVRNKTAEQLAEARAGVSHLEEHAQRLRDELTDAQRALADLEKTAGAERQDTDKLKAQAAELEARLKTAEKELDEARKAIRAKKESFAVIPFEGPNRTSRRPVYIECRANAVILQPDGITLTEEDFPVTLGPSNPLAAALMAAREYLVRNQMAGIGEDGEPYPLLLVRPDGIEAYIAARAAMTSWASDFGYEFIEQDWPLEFPPPDPNMSRAMARAIEVARLRQAQMALYAPGLVNQQNRSAMRSSGRGGSSDEGGNNGRSGFGAKGNSRTAGGSGARHGAISAGNAGSFAAKHASATNGRDSSGRSPYDSLPAAPGGGNGGGINGNGGPNAGSPYGMPGGIGLNAGGGNPNGVSGPGGYGQPGSGTGNGVPNGVSQPTGNGGPGTPGNGPVFPANGQPGNSPPGYAGPGGGPGGNAAAGNGPPGSTASGNGQGGNGQANNGQPGSGQAGNGQSGGGQSGGGGDQPGSSPFASGASAGAASSGGGGVGMNQGAATPSATSSAYADIQMGQKPTDGSSPFNTKGRTYAQSGQGSSASSSKSPDGGTQSSGGNEAGSQQRDPQQPPEGQQRHMVESLAKSRGKNWSLPEHAQYQTPVSRPIPIDCRGDRLTLVAEPGDRRGNKVIAMPGSAAQAIDPLVKSVMERIENWGIAGRNMYWRPILVVNVAPDGAARFAELQTLLHDSGLDIRQKGAK